MASLFTHNDFMSRTNKDRSKISKRWPFLSVACAYVVRKRMKACSKSKRKTLKDETNGRALKLGLTDSWFFD